MLSLEIGIACNNRCGFCCQQVQRLGGVAGLRPFEEVTAKIADAAAAGETELSLLGGEPTIHPRFLDMLRAARAVGMRTIGITTNGRVLADPARFAAAAEAGLTSLGVSVHGPDAATHDGLTGVPGSFVAALSTIEHALAAGMPVNTFTLVNRRNLDLLPETAARLRAAGVRLVLFQPFLVNVLSQEEYAVGIKEVRAPLLRALRQGFSLGYQVKLYNFPICHFLEVLPIVDLGRHGQPGAFGGNREIHIPLEGCAGCALELSCGGLASPLLPAEGITSVPSQRISAATVAAALAAGGRLHRAWRQQR